MAHAAPQKTQCPLLVLLRSQSAKERFCRSTCCQCGGKKERVIKEKKQKKIKKEKILSFYEDI